MRRNPKLLELIALLGLFGLLINISLPWSSPALNRQGNTLAITATKNPDELQLYGNLSCPFEWAKYSCIHQGRLLQAERGHVLALEAWRKFTPQEFPLPYDKAEIPKLLMVGDSTMRQIFVALGCFFWLRGEITDYYVDWEASWPCHGTPNCVEHGIHSGFNTGHFTVGASTLEPNLEVFFVPIGGSLRFLQEAIVAKWKKELDVDRQISFSLKQNPLVFNLTKRDIIVYNIGLHVQDRTAIYAKLDEFGRALLALGPARPKFVYMNTITQHFPSETGRFDEKLKMPQDQYSCKASVSSNPLLDTEKSKMQTNINADLIFHPQDEEMGLYHIGGNDCTHYCMPGLPDVFALRLLTLLLTSFFK